MCATVLTAARDRASLLTRVSLLVVAKVFLESLSANVRLGPTQLWKAT
jgi:hypothetical protein